MLTKSSTELVRQRNSVLVLAALRRHGALAHTEIADSTKLSSATVSAITADLEKAQIIEKSEHQAASGRGRPRVMFRQRRDCGYLVVVIISSDGVQYSLVDYAGKLIDRFSEERSHDPAGAERFVASVRDGLARILSRSKVPREKVLLISISSKGLVHPTEPVLVWSPIFGSNQIDFESALRPDWQARILLGNETQLVAAALGAHEENTRPTDFRALAALSLGHSIGLGIVRRTGQGEREISAPNFGHMLHMANGGLCRCGSRDASRPMLASTPFCVWPSRCRSIPFRRSSCLSPSSTRSQRKRATGIACLPLRSGRPASRSETDFHVCLA